MNKNYEVQANKKGDPAWYGNVDVWNYMSLAPAVARFVFVKVTRSWSTMIVK